MRPSFLRPLSFTLLGAFAVAGGAHAQTTPAPASATPPPQLSPQAAYQDALHPLEVTRHNIANWSGVELAAMNVAIAKAKVACDARQPAAYTGPELIDLDSAIALIGRNFSHAPTSASVSGVSQNGKGGA